LSRIWLVQLVARRYMDRAYSSSQLSQVGRTRLVHIAARSWDVHGSCDGDELVDVVIVDPHEAWRSLCSSLPQGLSLASSCRSAFFPTCLVKQVVAKISMILCNLEREREKEDAA